MNKWVGYVVALGALCAVSGASAHHSFSDYDQTKKWTLTGTLTKVEFRNPHIGLEVDVKTKGKTGLWEFSGPSPIDWRRAGWAKSDFVVGETITITGFPKRDGSKHLSINILKNSKGKSFGQASY